MGTGESQAVLTQLGAIASERDWTEVTEFISLLPEANQVLIEEPGDVNAAPLADWIAALLPGVPVTTVPLEATAGVPGTGLSADKIVAVFRCGQFLTPASVDAARQIMARPSGSYIVVFIGAEVIQGPEDLRIVERGVWQALVAKDGERWDGQDLASAGCLLWAAQDDSGFMSARLAFDAAALRDWLHATHADNAVLATQRAQYALELAEREVTRAAEAGRASEWSADYARLRKAQGALADGRSRVLRLLDGAAADLDEDIAVTLHDLRGRLHRELDQRLRQHGDERWSDEDLRREIENLVRSGLALWRGELLTIVARHWGHSADLAGQQLQKVDWDVVNAFCPNTHGYPGAIIAPIRSLSEVDLVIDDPPASGSAASLPAPDTRGSVFRITASGAALATVAALIAGPALIPVLTAGAAGVAGAGFIDRHLATRSNHQAAERSARSEVTQAVDAVLDTAQEQTRAIARSVRRSVAEEFRRLSETLHAAVLQHAAGPEPAAWGGQPSAAADPDRQLIALLRGQLMAALDDDAPEH